MTSNNNLISTYTFRDAIEDGMLIEVFKYRWKDLTGGKPLVATKGVYKEFSLAALSEIWNEYVKWRTKTLTHTPWRPAGKAEELPIFVSYMNNKRLWVIEDGESFTILFPEEY